MNTLILYATRYGATQIIAQQLSSEIGKNVTLRNINDGEPDLAYYDAVIIGGSIYMNKIQKSISAFIRKNEKTLLTKKLFIGCFTQPDTAGYLEQFFPTDLLSHASAKGMLGGLMQYEKMNPIYRGIFKKLKKIDNFNKNYKEPKIETERIKLFAEKIK